MTVFLFEKFAKHNADVCVCVWRDAGDGVRHGFLTSGDYCYSRCDLSWNRPSRFDTAFLCEKQCGLQNEGQIFVCVFRMMLGMELRQRLFTSDDCCYRYCDLEMEQAIMP